MHRRGRAPGQTVLAVADLHTLDLMAYVLERDLGSVRVGQAVAVTADPFPGRVFNGVVVSTNQHAEFTPRNVQTQVSKQSLRVRPLSAGQSPDAAAPAAPPTPTSPLLLTCRVRLTHQHCPESADQIFITNHHHGQGLITR